MTIVGECDLSAHMTRAPQHRRFKQVRTLSGWNIAVLDEAGQGSAWTGDIGHSPPTVDRADLRPIWRREARDGYLECKLSARRTREFTSTK